MITEITDKKKLKGWVLFDGECRFCTKLVDHFTPLLHRHAFRTAPLQAPWVKKQLAGCTDLLSEMRLLLPDGTVYGGAEALVQLARVIGWARPLYWAALLPGGMGVLRKAYAWVARRRNCLGGACRVQTETPFRTALIKWGPLTAAPILATTAKGYVPAWVFMWVMALALLAGAKWVTVFDFVRCDCKVARRRLMAYFLLWPGMDVIGFCTNKAASAPRSPEWVAALAKTLLGAILVWEVLPLLKGVSALFIGWLGMWGLVLVLHFGLFHLLSLFWRTWGVDARPIMHSPLTAPSLSAFWGGHWNRGFSDLMHKHFLGPLARRMGVSKALLTIFLLSGLLHELVISFPARGGCGLPTAYFAVQGLGLLLERSRFGRRHGLSSGWKGRCFALLIAGGPVFWLFPPPFIRNVILPMLRAIGAN